MPHGKSWTYNDYGDLQHQATPELALTVRVLSKDLSCSFSTRNLVQISASPSVFLWRLQKANYMHFIFPSMIPKWFAWLSCHHKSKWNVPLNCVLTLKMFQSRSTRVSKRLLLLLLFFAAPVVHASLLARNQHHSRSQTCSDSAGSLTCCDTKELPCVRDSQRAIQSQERREMMSVMEGVSRWHLLPFGMPALRHILRKPIKG